MKQKIKEIIQEADMVLVGIGEEFESSKEFRQSPLYIKLQAAAEAMEKEWLIPAVQNYAMQTADSQLTKAVCGLSGLADLLKDKNYFVVTTTTNDIIWKCGFQENRIVAPCGGSRFKQCSHQECEGVLESLTEDDRNSIQAWIESEGSSKVDLGVCPRCSSPMILNNIYTEKYQEQGYLDQWSLYTKWLQGTLNRKLCILELGVGMQCPSVIRFPFEKIGYFNQKSSFIRVNANLYQLTEELKGKGMSISENAVDFIASMC